MKRDGKEKYIKKKEKKIRNKVLDVIFCSYFLPSNLPYHNPLIPWVRAACMEIGNTYHFQTESSTKLWKNPFVSIPSLQMEKWELNKVIYIPGIRLEVCDRDRDFMVSWTQCLSPKVTLAVHWEQWSLQMCPVQKKDFHWKPLISSKSKVLVPLHKHNTYRASLHFFFLSSPSQSAKSAAWKTAVTDTPLKDIGSSKTEI